MMGMLAEMNINDFFKTESTYVIAEISQNHDGSLGMAHAYIDAVAKTGADAIKFQTHIASEESTKHEPFRVKFSYCDKTRYDYWKRMEFSEEEWKGLYDHAISLGLDFLSSPFSVKALELLERIGIPAWKFGSGEVFNKILIDKAIKTGKPIILSTGLSTFDEIIEQADKVMRAGNPLILMECTTAYPSSADRIPLNLIKKYIDTFDCPIGISDHSATIYPGIAAVAIGARCVETHVTMSHEMFGPDVPASITTQELAALVKGVHFVDEMKKCAIDKTALSEETLILRQTFSKSLYANRNIANDEVITANDIGIKKPYSQDALGVDDYDMLIGSVAKVDIKKDEIFKQEYIK